MAQNETRPKTPKLTYVDQISGVETTGHEWDGIRELDNPLPRWWLWTFYACTLFSLGYVIWYPALPLFDTSTQGLSGQSIRKSLSAELAAIEAKDQQIDEQIIGLTLAEIRADENLSSYAFAGGASLYKINCSQCHGSAAQGAAGIPNLSDDDWLWGGSPEAIYTSIFHGIRNEDDENARFSLMPAFGGGLLPNDEISGIAAWIRNEAKLDVKSTQAELETAKASFQENCASCHGTDARGDYEIGAPNLIDAIWFYGSDQDEVTAQIRNPKHGVMPPWGEKLGEAAVKKLTLYVHSLGGGEEAASDE